MVSLYESISVYVPVPKEVGEGMEVYYTEAESELNLWKKAYAPVYDDVNGQYSTSIVGLKEDTEYLVKVRVGKYSFNRKVGFGSIQTWTSNPEISRVIPLSDIYTGGALIIDGGVYATNDEWIKIIGSEDVVIDAGNTSDNALYINRAKKIIFENVTIKGGRKNGVYIGKNAENIRLINCDISGWGRTGELKVISKSGEETAVAYVDSSGKAINYDAGIRLDNTKKITIERCFIHDPNGTTTTWAGNQNGISWSYSHPQGMCGMYVATSETVVRYNDITGNENHRFNDGIEGYGNGSINGGFKSDCDIYGNFIAFGQDDGTELDGGARNVRFFNNRITNFYSGISTAANMVGPSFVFNNVIHYLRDGTDYPNFHTKNGGFERGGFGITHYFYNTFIAESGRRDYGISEVGVYNAVTRNNIIIGTRYQVRTADDAGEYNCISSFDYDLLGNWSNASSGYAGKTYIKMGIDREENAILGMPTFIGRTYGLLGLTTTSLGYGQAVKIDGFKGFNMGAIDVNDSGLIPKRPISVVADKYVVTMNGSTSAVEILSSENTDLSFSVGTNDPNGCLHAHSNKSILKAGETATITINSVCNHTVMHDGVVFVRFSNGLSIPIHVRNIIGN